MGGRSGRAPGGPAGAAGQDSWGERESCGSSEGWAAGSREREVDRRPGLGRLICSDLLVESAVESTGRRKPGGYSIEQQEPQRPPDWESLREQRARYLKALSFLRGAVSRKPTLGPSVQHRGPAALVC